MASKGAKAGGRNTRPKYAEMIMEAIKALNDKNGSQSTKTRISEHIESTHGELPPIHYPILTHHLNRMTASGQLRLIRNRYLIPDPNAPPMRRRGRPPGPKEPIPPPASKRPSDRPPESDEECGETVRCTSPEPAGAEPLATATASEDESGGVGLVEVKTEECDQCWGERGCCCR